MNKLKVYKFIVIKKMIPLLDIVCWVWGITVIVYFLFYFIFKYFLLNIKTERKINMIIFSILRK